MRIFYVLGLVLLLFSCAPSRFVEPLKKNELSVGANFGGPVIGFGKVLIPTPLTAVEVGYGVEENLTVHGGLHLTSALFSNFQTDAGVTWKFLNQKKAIPNISVSPGFNFNYTFRGKSAKFWPKLDLNFFWNYGKRRNYFYAGVNNFFDFSNRDNTDYFKSSPWLFSPQIGHVVKGKNQQWEFTVELKFLGVGRENSYSFVPYRSMMGKYGASGFYLGFRKIIGKK